jgi:hypothetical protein
VLGPQQRAELLVRQGHRTALRKGSLPLTQGATRPVSAVKYQPTATSALSRKMRVEGAVEARGQRVHALPEPMLQIMNVGAIGKAADCLAKTIVIVVQQGETLSKPQERGFIRRLRHVEIALVLPKGNLKSVKPSHKSPNKCGGARSDRGQSGDGPLKKAPGRAFR